MAFESDLTLIAIAGRPDLWRFAAPLVWSDGDDSVVVPRGFITDLASIPRALDWAPDLDRTGLSRRPAALHDWLYGGDRSRGKDWADKTLRMALLAEGMSWIGAYEYWFAVHAFGAHAWANDNRVLRAEHFYAQADFDEYMAGLVPEL